MKKIITLLFSVFFLLTSSAQMLDYDRDSKWFLGINTGAAWNTTDVKNKTNIAWGLTLGRAFNYNYGKKISFDLRFRYLGGKWRGQDYDTTSLTGYNASITTPGAVRTYYDTLGYTINNFQTQIHEFGLELVIHANSLRENTGWDPYIFGGVNLVWNQTKGDLLYEDSTLFYSDIYYYSPNGMTKREWRNMRDKNYDLALDGSSLSHYNVDFMPSLGFGLGYQVGPRFQIGLEHKTTFTMNDLFDGYIDPTERWGMFANDIYHYTNLYLKFHIRHYTEEERLEQQAQNTQTTHTNPNNTTNPNPGGGCLAPRISVSKPRNNSITVYENQYTIQAIIEEVAGRNNLVFDVNGQISSNFIFNPNTERFEAKVFLQPGNNIIKIEAGNGCGKDERVISINYVQCTAPIVQFVNPQGNGITVTNANYTVNANVVNATSVEYYVNGNRINTFSHNATTGNFISNTVLKRGINTLRIVAVNECGQVEQSVSIEYSSCVSPFINITQGSQSQIVDNAQFTFQATIIGVTTQNNINFRLNGMNKTFSFNPTTHHFSSTITLKRGTNTLELFGSNTCGTDRKTVTIEYVPCSLPTVTFISPINGNSLNAQTLVKVKLTNITNKNQIHLSVNGAAIQSGTFDVNTQVFQSRITLNNGTNTILVTATNDCGTISQSVNTIFSPCVSPEVSILLPNQSMSTDNNAIIKASILNIANRNQIVVTINGVVYTGGTYSPLTKIYQTNIVLNPGLNSIQIKATNDCGNDVKNYTIQYKPCYEPIVNILSPLENSTTESTVLLNFALQNISSISQIQATINGNIITGGNYSPATKRYEAVVNLNEGLNHIVIVATNSCGAINQSIQIKKVTDVRKVLICHDSGKKGEKPIEMYILLSEWAEHQAHGDVLGGCPQIEDPIVVEEITICHKDPKTNQQSTIVIDANDWAMHEAHGDTKGTCRQISDPNSALTYIICHTDPKTGEKKTIKIKASEWVTHQAHGDSQEPCPVVVNEKIITICHKIPGTMNQETIQIKESEWATHQAHGDKLGACTQVGSIGNGGTGTITICHKVPGTDDTQEMVIPQNQWLIHQRHGDKLGPCDNDDDDDDEDNDEEGRKNKNSKKTSVIKP